MGRNVAAGAAALIKGERAECLSRIIRGGKRVD
jgi:hypothetical protein